MKTPMQELISVIRKRQEDEDVQPFMWLEQIVELAESMLEKEKEVIEDIIDIIDSENSGQSAEQRLDEIKTYLLTFNTK